jgi:vacuolar iron transporter family protein
MNSHSLKTGLSFGLTSGVITTLGLMIGLSAGTESKIVVIGGILTIAVADAFSDALGIHLSEESEGVHTEKEIWFSTLATFLAKFIFTLTFLVPVLIFQLNQAIIISIVWGIILLLIASFYLAREQKKRPASIIVEHVLIAVVVIFLTYFLGRWINNIFK